MGKLPNGVEIRRSTNSEAIRVCFMLNGRRCRETLKIPVSDENIKWAAGLVCEIQNRIERGTFVYSEFFPNSRSLKANTEEILRAQETPERQRARMVAKHRVISTVADKLWRGKARASMSKDQILSMSRFTTDDHCGVYFLIDKEEIVYVGQSTNIHGRVRRHKVSGIIEFSGYS